MDESGCSAETTNRRASVNMGQRQARVLRYNRRYSASTQRGAKRGRGQADSDKSTRSVSPCPARASRTRCRLRAVSRARQCDGGELNRELRGSTRRNNGTRAQGRTPERDRAPSRGARCWGGHRGTRSSRGQRGDEARTTVGEGAWLGEIRAPGSSDERWPWR
jgi:hypothetical protein